MVVHNKLFSFCFVVHICMCLYGRIFGFNVIINLCCMYKFNFMSSLYLIESRITFFCCSSKSRVHTLDGCVNGIFNLLNLSELKCWWNLGWYFGHLSFVLVIHSNVRALFVMSIYDMYSFFRFLISTFL